LAVAGYTNPGVEVLQRALKVDPEYSDAHYFLGLIYLDDEHHPAQAITELQIYLEANPPATLAADARSAIAEARQQLRPG
jgi:tetratricopeptide (TPR) repeat protein